MGNKNEQAQEKRSSSQPLTSYIVNRSQSTSLLIGWVSLPIARSPQYKVYDWLIFTRQNSKPTITNQRQYTLEPLSYGTKIKYTYIRVRLLDSRLKEKKLQLHTSLTFTVGPNYNKLLCWTGALDCARSYGNVVQPEYFQSPHASTSACTAVMLCFYCVVREEIACISRYEVQQEALQVTED